jgi:haloacetate dehalogenase
MQLCKPNSHSCDCPGARLSGIVSAEQNGEIAMTNLDPRLLTRWLASGNALGRRSFLESCLGVIAGGLAAQGSPALAQTVTARPVDFFPGFRRQTIQTSGTSINMLVGGDGPPVLLLHGYPQTHVEWRKIAPELAKNYTLVIPDLRGYGDSGKPPDGDNHINYSKRAMALDQVEVMEKLGFRQFAVVSHDRGARVAHRLVLDHPDRLTKLVMMDICPTHYMYKTTDRQFATGYFHWFFLIQSAPFPETLIGNNVDAVLKLFMGPVMPKSIEPDAYAEYRRCFSNPATIHASCEDYRAAASIDLAHDEADMDKKILCPVLVLWGANGLVGKKYDVLAIWRDRATHVTGKALPSSHWLAEEVPDETLAEVKRFLAA